MTEPLPARRSLPSKLLRRLRQGDVRNAAYLTYYHSYLSLIDLRKGTRLAGSSRASDLGGSDTQALGNFPAHPRLVARMLRLVPDRPSKSLVDVGCGSGSTLRVALELGFGRVYGLELFPEVAELARRNADDPRCDVGLGDALQADLRGYDVMFMYRPFPMLGEYPGLIARASPEWLVMWDLEEVAVAGYEVRATYRHPIYASFRGRLLKRAD